MTLASPDTVELCNLWNRVPVPSDALTALMQEAMDAGRVFMVGPDHIFPVGTLTPDECAARIGRIVKVWESGLITAEEVIADVERTIRQTFH